MKKFLFLASALLWGWSAFATEPETDLLSQGFDYFDEGTEQASATSITYTAQYKGAGWDMNGADLLGDGFEAVTVKFTADRTNSGQITLNVSYFDAEGNEYFDATDARCQKVSSAAAGEATVAFKEGYTVDKIHIQSGWNDPAKNDIAASDTTPVTVTVIEATLKGRLPIAPASVSNPINFEDFDAGYKFATGSDYYLMPAWGWQDDLGATVTIAAKDDGKSLKIEPKNSDLAAIFKTLNLPEGKTVADIKSISFKSFWESYSVSVDDVTQDLVEGDDVENTEALLYIGKTDVTLGNGVGFKNASCISFKGNPTPLVGVIGDWTSYTITLDNILDTDINNIASDPNYGLDGFDEVADLNTISFGIGFNANNGVYYIDDIVFNFDGASVENVSAASAKVYSIPGGLAINGNDGAIIYGIDGRVVASTSASTISLPKGIYIVKVGGEVVKAFVK